MGFHSYKPESNFGNHSRNHSNVFRKDFKITAEIYLAEIGKVPGFWIVLVTYDKKKIPISFHPTIHSYECAVHYVKYNIPREQFSLV